MRPFVLALVTTVVWAGWSPAQTYAPLAEPVTTSPVSDNARNEYSHALITAPSSDPPWSIDLLLGLPTGVRVQRSLGEGAGRDWLIEGFAGLDLVIFPMVGGGIRRRLKPFCGERDALEINPGIGGYVMYNEIVWFGGTRRTVECLAADVDILWQHNFNEHCGSHIGLRLGGLSAWTERRIFLPIVSIVFGLQF